MDLLEDDNKVCHSKLDKLADTVAFQSLLIKELKEKVEFYESERLQPNLLIRGHH